MSELKRPEQYVQFESIKPELKGITEFYTQKVKDYQYRLKQLNEYADALENDITRTCGDDPISPASLFRKLGYYPHMRG